MRSCVSRRRQGCDNVLPTCEVPLLPSYSSCEESLLSCTPLRHNQSINQSINQINQSINQSIKSNQSINQSINQSFIHSINQSIKQSINQSINRSVSQSVSQSINQSINQSNGIKIISLCTRSRHFWVLQGNFDHNVGQPDLVSLCDQSSLVDLCVQGQRTGLCVWPLCMCASSVNMQTDIRTERLHSDQLT